MMHVNNNRYACSVTVLENSDDEVTLGSRLESIRTHFVVFRSSDYEVEGAAGKFPPCWVDHCFPINAPHPHRT